MVQRFRIPINIDLEEEELIEKPEPWTPLQRQQAREKVQELKIPKAHRITARQVNEISFGRRFNKTRERLLLENKYHSAKTGLESISKPDVSLSTASTLEQVSAAIKARTPVIKDIRKFNQDPALVKLRCTKRHRSTRAWACLTSNLRAMATDHTIQRLTPQEQGTASVDLLTGYCSRCQTYEINKSRLSAHYCHPTHCIHTMPEARHVAFIGTAGTGVGSRLKGNFRLGGGKIREQHRQYGTVVMTDEYMSSQRCCFCFKKTRPARSRRVVDSNGTQKLVNLHGAKECSNLTCPAFKIGYTTRPRDTQACICIGTSGFSALGLSHDTDSHKELFNVEGKIAIAEAVKMEVDAVPAKPVNMEVDAVPVRLVKTEEEDDDTNLRSASDSEDMKSTQPVNLLKEPITPFRSFLRPNERQHKLAGNTTRRQLPGGSMATPARDIA